MARTKPPPRPKRQPTGDYDRGYCLTPVETRWPKGFCPNPKGRPRRQPECTAKLVADELDKQIWIIEDGVRKRVSKRQALVMATIQKAINGDARARKDVADAEADAQKIRAAAQERFVTLVFDEEEERQKQMVTAELDTCRARISLLESHLTALGVDVSSITPQAASGSKDR